jgi:hypothetical protein
LDDDSGIIFQETHNLNHNNHCIDFLEEIFHVKQVPLIKFNVRTSIGVLATEFYNTYNLFTCLTIPISEM